MYVGRYIAFAILMVVFIPIAPSQTPPALTPQGAPTVMRLCVNQKCQTLTWKGDHYDGVNDGEKTTFATYVIEEWSAKGVRMKGTSLLEYKSVIKAGSFSIPRKSHIEGDYTGVVANSGNSVEEGVLKYSGPFGSGQLTYELTWKSSDDDVAIACSAPATSLPAPTNLTVCGGPCITQQDGDIGALTFQGNKGKGSWVKGSRANLTVQQWDAQKVIIIRQDTPTSATAGLIATYTGKVCGDTIKGRVTVSWPGRFENVSVPWTATIPASSCDAISDDNEALVETGRELLLFRNAAGAFGCFSRAAKLGDMQARTATALMYRDGIGTKVDFKEAKDMFMAAAISQDYNAQVALAEIYDLGLGVPRNDMEVNLWRQRAFNNPAAAAARQNRQDAKDREKLMFVGLCAMVEAFSQPTVYVRY